MEAFGVGPVGEEFEQSGGHASGDAERICRRAGVEPAQACCGRRGAEDAAHAGGMEPPGVEEPPAAAPSLVETSLPATIAASVSFPEQPCSSAVARAAGTTLALTWTTEAACVSS